jgi:phosphoserine phosphatase
VSRGVAAFPWRLVTFDIDGTLTRVHGWRGMAEAFGRLPAFEASNRRFFAHEIGEDPHLADLLDIAVGHSVAEVEAVLAATPKLDGIGDGVAELRRAGARVALLTHNPPYVCRWYARTFGFEDFEGTEGTIVQDGVIARPGPVHADKVGGMERLIARSGATPGSSVHLGDGASDAEVFRRVGGGVAVNAKLAEVRAAADASVSTTRMEDLVAVLRGLRPRA